MDNNLRNASITLRGSSVEVVRILSDSGTYGTVHQVKCGGSSLAMKSVCVRHKSQYKRGTFEVDLLEKLATLGASTPLSDGHKKTGVLREMGVCFVHGSSMWKLEGVEYMSIFMDLYAGDLTVLVEQELYIHVDTVIIIARGIVSMARGLHNCGFAHCDMKAENVLVSDIDVFKETEGALVLVKPLMICLCDLGSAVSVDSYMGALYNLSDETQRCQYIESETSPLLRSPEMYKEGVMLAFELDIVDSKENEGHIISDQMDCHSEPPPPPSDGAANGAAVPPPPPPSKGTVGFSHTLPPPPPVSHTRPTQLKVPPPPPPLSRASTNMDNQITTANHQSSKTEKFTKFDDDMEPDFGDSDNIELLKEDTKPNAIAAKLPDITQTSPHLNSEETHLSGVKYDGGCLKLEDLTKKGKNRGVDVIALDIWQIGCVLYYILFKELPFTVGTPTEIRSKCENIKSIVRQKLDKRASVIGSHWRSEKIGHLITLILSPAAARPTLEFISEYMKKLTYGKEQHSDIPHHDTKPANSRTVTDKRQVIDTITNTDKSVDPFGSHLDSEQKDDPFI